MMLVGRVKPNTFTFATVLGVWLINVHLNYGIQVHTVVIRCAFEVYNIPGNLLIRLYLKSGMVKEATIVLEVWQ